MSQSEGKREMSFDEGILKVKLGLSLIEGGLGWFEVACGI